MKTSLKLLWIPFLIFSQNILAQITGTIVDVTNEEPLEYATAAIFSQKDSVLVTGVITSQEGTFIINNESYYIDFDASSGLKPFVRNSNGNDELLVKITENKQNFNYNIIW